MGKCITKKDWMTVIRLAIMVILTVWFVYFWQGQAVIAYAAETYGDYELTGHAQNTGNAVEGGNGIYGISLLHYVDFHKIS